MLAASQMGSTAFQKGLGAIHSLSHPVGAVLDTHHGLTNAVIMPYVLDFNRKAIDERMTRLARFLNLPNPGFAAVQKWILDLRTEIKIPHTLKEIGVDDKRVETFDDLYTILDSHKPDDVVKVNVARGEETVPLNVKVVILNPTNGN